MVRPGTLRFSSKGDAKGRRDEERGVNGERQRGLLTGPRKAAARRGEECEGDAERERERM
jgi:hypothetical protein